MDSIRTPRRVKVALVLVLGVLVLGTMGYMVLEHLTAEDALYTTVSMMTTVGDVVYPLSAAGRAFTIVVMVAGIGSVLYTFGVVAEYVVEGHLGSTIRRHFMTKKIETLRDHSIVCGFGRVGSQIVEDLQKAHMPFIVIDNKETSVERSLRSDHLTLAGDATTDAVLEEAGIGRAKCLLAATDDDSRNISITLSARHLSPGLFIVARANHPETEVKLKLAGADRVLSPYTIAGHRMANLALRPGVVEFFQSIARVGNTELAIEEVLLSGRSPLVGQTMEAAQRSPMGGATLVALKKSSGLVTASQPNIRIETGDAAIMVGAPGHLTAFAQANGAATARDMGEGAKDMQEARC